MKTHEHDARMSISVEWRHTNTKLESKYQEQLLIEGLKNFYTILSDTGIKIVFESDFPPQKLERFIEKFPSENFGINYDIGNSASLGYDMVEEISSYGHLISNIHIKDRSLNGGSCVLGKGDANFEKFFDLIYKIPKNYLLIMQSFRDEDGLNIFKDQLHHLKRVLNGKKYY